MHVTALTDQLTCTVNFVGTYYFMCMILILIFPILFLNFQDSEDE